MVEDLLHKIFRFTDLYGWICRHIMNPMLFNKPCNSTIQNYFVKICTNIYYICSNNVAVSNWFAHVDKTLDELNLLCWTKLQLLAIIYIEKRKMCHWFHLEHNIHRRDVCCYILDCRKSQYYQYCVSSGSLLE